MVSLRVSGLAVGFAARTVLSGIDLALGAGEVLCVLGPNGSGKTTLFRTLLGLIAARRGNVSLEGEPIDTLSRREIARRVAYVPQALASAFDFTVLDMVLMGRTSHVDAFRVPGGADREAAEAALQTLRIEALAGRPFNAISGGERQLALIARALAQHARVLIMDEPAANLDLGNQVRLLQTILALGAKGFTILFSTHDPDHAFACASTALLVGEGRVHACGAPTTVLHAGALTQLYGAPIEIMSRADGTRVCVPSIRSATAAGASAHPA